jgi:hypothetical protein
MSSLHCCPCLQRTPSALARHQWWRLITPLLVQPDGWRAIVFVFTSILIVGALALGKSALVDSVHRVRLFPENSRGTLGNLTAPQHRSQEPGCSAASRYGSSTNVKLAQLNSAEWSSCSARSSPPVSALSMAFRYWSALFWDPPCIGLMIRVPAVWQPLTHSRDALQFIGEMEVRISLVLFALLFLEYFFFLYASSRSAAEHALQVHCSAKHSGIVAVPCAKLQPKRQPIRNRHRNGNCWRPQSSPRYVHPWITR